jgi:hypothetical protein
MVRKMGFFQWLGNGVKAVNNFFDSVYMHLPETVRGLLWGLGMVCTFFWVVFFVTDYMKLIRDLLGWLFPFGK